MSVTATIVWPYLLGWLPLAGPIMSCIVAWRTGWATLVRSSLVWAALGFAFFAFALRGSSASDAAGIALFLFLLPCLVCGSVTLLVRQRRHGERMHSERYS